MANGDPSRLSREIPRWISATRKESHRVLGDVELGLRRAADHLSASIAARSGPDDLAPIADIQIDAAQFLATLTPLLDEVADRMARTLADQVQPLDQLAMQRGGVVEATVKAARASWTRSIRAHQAQIAQYIAGYVEGGGLALALLTELAPEDAGRTGDVAEILSARVAFVPKRSETAIATWLAEVQRDLETLVRQLGEPVSEAKLAAEAPVRAPMGTPQAPAPAGRVPVAAPPPPPGRAQVRVPPVAAQPQAPVQPPRAPPASGPVLGSSGGSAAPSKPAVDPRLRTTLDGLIAKASSLGVRVRNIPDRPTEQYVSRLATQLAQVEAKRDAATPPGTTSRVSLETLLRLADALQVRLKDVPQRPSDLYLEKLRAKLVEVAERRGVPLPPELGGPQPAPAPVTRESAATTDVAPDADSERQSRIDTLIQRATEAGLDLGRIPVDPTHEWVAQTEDLLKSAIDRRNAERRASREQRDAERRVQLDRLVSVAERVGVELLPPKFPTDEWLARAELRIASMLLTPRGGGAPVDAGRAERFNRVYIHAAEASVDLGDIPPDPDATWLDWAEEMVAEATGAHTIVVEAEAEADDREQAWLVFEEGTIQENRWPIGENAEVTIGRGRGNTVQIRNDAGVSRRHCTLRMEQGAVVIRDAGSTKGVVVDGQQVDEAMLVGGEQIVLGETLFVFRSR